MFTTGPHALLETELKEMPFGVEAAALGLFYRTLMAIEPPEGMRKILRRATEASKHPKILL